MHIRSLSSFLVFLTAACVFTPSHSSSDATMRDVLVVKLHNTRQQTDTVTISIEGAQAGTFALYSDRTHEPKKASRLRHEAIECFAKKSLEDCKRQLSNNGAVLLGRAAKSAGSGSATLEGSFSPPLNFDADWTEEWDGYAMIVRADKAPADEDFRVHVAVKSSDIEHGSSEVELAIVEKE